MILKEGKINNIKFFYREVFSDLKTFEEVLDKNLVRFKECCDRLMNFYELKFIDKRFYDLVVTPGFVAPCTNIFCYEKN